VKVLVTGAGGQVGRALRATAPAGWQLLCCGRAQLDIADPARVGAVLSEFRPEVIINLAAYTAVDRAESDIAAAERANALGPGVLARHARGLPGCRLLHVSTDFVFDGTSRRPYRPDDLANPLGVYGHTKRDGELAVLADLGERAAVLRTAWVYSPSGNNFLLTMVRLMKQRGMVRVVNDQVGTPTAASSLATALVALAQAPKVAGVLHWTDAGMTSWHEFAAAIAHEGFALGLFTKLPVVEAIGTADYPTPARRPAYSVLDTSAAATALGIQPQPWRECLKREMAEVARG
jgi:dTDP-4-dehydrorhamnose reductase